MLPEEVVRVERMPENQGFQASVTLRIAGKEVTIKVMNASGFALSKMCLFLNWVYDPFIGLLRFPSLASIFLASVYLCIQIPVCLHTGKVQETHRDSFSSKTKVSLRGNQIQCLLMKVFCGRSPW